MRSEGEAFELPPRQSVDRKASVGFSLDALGLLFLSRSSSPLGPDRWHGLTRVAVAQPRIGLVVQIGDRAVAG